MSTKSVSLLASRLKYTTALHPWSSAPGASANRSGHFANIESCSPIQTLRSQYRFFSSEQGEVRSTRRPIAMRNVGFQMKQLFDKCILCNLN